MFPDIVRVTRKAIFIFNAQAPVRSQRVTLVSKVTRYRLVRIRQNRAGRNASVETDKDFRAVCLSARNDGSASIATVLRSCKSRAMNAKSQDDFEKIRMYNPVLSSFIAWGDKRFDKSFKRKMFVSEIRDGIKHGRDGNSV